MKKYTREQNDIRRQVFSCVRNKQWKEQELIKKFGNSLLVKEAITESYLSSKEKCLSVKEWCDQRIRLRFIALNLACYLTSSRHTRGNRKVLTTDYLGIINVSDFRQRKTTIGIPNEHEIIEVYFPLHIVRRLKVFEGQLYYNHKKIEDNVYEGDFIHLNYSNSNKTTYLTTEHLYFYYSGLYSDRSKKHSYSSKEEALEKSKIILPGNKWLRTYECQKLIDLLIEHFDKSHFTLIFDNEQECFTFDLPEMNDLRFTKIWDFKAYCGNRVVCADELYNVLKNYVSRNRMTLNKIEKIFNQNNAKFDAKIMKYPQAMLESALNYKSPAYRDFKLDIMMRKELRKEVDNAYDQFYNEFL